MTTYGFRAAIGRHSMYEGEHALQDFRILKGRVDEVEEEELSPIRMPRRQIICVER